MDIKTSNEVLARGLELVNISIERQQRVANKTNVQDFISFYGSHPGVYAVLWETMQSTELADARITNPTPQLFDRYLMTLHYLKAYPLEKHLKRFGCHEQTARKWIKFFVTKIAALKSALIVWPSDEEWGNHVFIISHDGVNFGMNEPTHDTLHKDKRYFDRKGGKAGHTYEIALHLWENRIVWFNGPFPANSGGDRAIFLNGGLNDAMPKGKKSIADKIYKGLAKVALHNSLDCEEVRVFKRRARARQEVINTRMKTFGVLKQRFRHGLARHDQFVSAVAVIVALQLENGSPLFDL